MRKVNKLFLVSAGVACGSTMLWDSQRESHSAMSDSATTFKVVFIWPIFIFNEHFVNARGRDPSSKRSRHQAHKIHLLSRLSMCVC